MPSCNTYRGDKRGEKRTLLPKQGHCNIFFFKKLQVFTQNKGISFKKNMTKIQQTALVTAIGFSMDLLFFQD